MKWTFVMSWLIWKWQVYLSSAPQPRYYPITGKLEANQRNGSKLWGSSVIIKRRAVYRRTENIITPAFWSFESMIEGHDLMPMQEIFLMLGDGGIISRPESLYKLLPRRKLLPWASQLQANAEKYATAFAFGIIRIIAILLMLLTN